ncbi:MAG: adenylosuccinate lyase [Phycisphaerales bacterium]|nr:adenylosuccinate lyase [Phycisphaerales bacterium]
MNSNDTYTSPLATRNASPEMLRLWSPRHKFNTWRRIWLAAAEAQHEVTKDRGSPLVTGEQVEELRAVVERGITDEEIARAADLERDLRHDVMSHVHCLGEQCPKARAIIHLGLTSQDVVCNADLHIIYTGADLLWLKTLRVAVALGEMARLQVSIPCLAFTHYQAAQPTTVGRRCALWAADLLESPLMMMSALPLGTYRGLRGATGTQAAMLHLLNGDTEAVDTVEQVFLEKYAGRARPWAMNIPYSPELCGPETFSLTSQTYPRSVDAVMLSSCAVTASVLHKIATDIRLLSNRKEVDEPFGKNQIGSSAMPYKRNPMKCERICGLTRFVMNLVGNAYDTAATQWLERTLDDSSNRRLSLPEAFLALDGALDLMHEVASGLVVHEAMVRKNLMAELPFLATENILMEVVKAGADRQEYHEIIRRHAQAAGMRVKQEGLENDLLDRLQTDKAFWSKARGGPLARELDWSDLMDPMKYVGRSVEQTERFLKEVVEPLREHYADELNQLGSSDRGV